MLPSHSELTPIMFKRELTHLGSEVSNYCHENICIFHERNIMKFAMHGNWDTYPSDGLIRSLNSEQVIN